MISRVPLLKALEDIDVCSSPYLLSHEVICTSSLCAPLVIEDYTPNLNLEGWLKKRGEKGVIKSWKSRWFVEKGKKLFYYTSRSSKLPQGFIDLLQMTQIVPFASKKKVINTQLKQNCPFIVGILFSISISPPLTLSFLSFFLI